MALFVYAVELYGGPDDGLALDLHPDVLPRCVHTEHADYVRDARLDLVRRDGTAVHRYRWDSRPPHQVEG